ncbi:hypothetical protein [Nocardioides sp. SR21]|uniref:hypothetical protein n=1 Tax=Nocardioides sp. SR21 TaxID=2919501 RepID=UPI001FAA33E8|nr:hypothetical protein [Nocardioides sp. SR21]
MSEEEDFARQAAFFRETMDPFMRVLLDAQEPWDAYDAVVSMRGAMLDFVEWGPDGGAVFVAWAELEDLYETGNTPIPDAHAALRQAAAEWLDRPSDASVAQFIEGWLKRVNQTVASILARDGDFWTSPE